MNPVSICEIIKAAFVLDALPVKSAFQSVILNDLVAEHPKLWYGVRFRIIDGLIWYALKIISIGKRRFLKYYNPNSFLSFKASLHPEKCFVESTKIWLTQQNFSFKYGSIEILFELIERILLISFFQF